MEAAFRGVKPTKSWPRQRILKGEDHLTQAIIKFFEEFLFHPPLVHFPIALWVTSGLFDLLYLRRRDVGMARIARVLIGLGLLGASVAAVMGYIDLRRLVAQGVGTGVVNQHRVHSLLAYVSTGVYLISFIGRRRIPPPFWVVALALPGVILIILTGYLGGELRKVM